MAGGTKEDTAIRDRLFVEAWRRHGGDVGKIAKDLGSTRHNVISRREAVQTRTGETLVTLNGPGGSVRAEFIEDIVGRYGALNISIRDGRILIGSDLHAVDYTPTAMRGMAQANKTLCPKFTIINGDDVDAPGAGKYPRNSWIKQSSVADDLRNAQQQLELLEGTRPAGGKLIRTLGNHDARFDSYLANHAEMFEGVPGMTLRDHFPKWENCVAVYVNGVQCIVKHRWHGGVHAAYNNVVKGGTTIVTGHTHSLKVTPYTNYNGTNYGVDCGMLADPSGEQFAYGEHNPANHRAGFCLLTFVDGNLMPPELAEVIGEGRIWFRGRIWNV